MKKYILLFLLVFHFGGAAEKDTLFQTNWVKKYYNVFEDEDCDACGCSASGGSMGFASMLNSNFVGIRYFKQRYRSRNALYSDAPWGDENYNTTQIWARIPIVNSVQISFLIPYHSHNRIIEDGFQEISGLGDITVIAMYEIYRTKKDSAIFSHSLQIGAGLKAPTGAFTTLNNTGSVNKSFQLGTGSWDFQFLSEYIIRRKKIGLNTMLNYVWKSENNLFYRYGNQVNYAATMFYLFDKNKVSFAPQFGIAGEIYASNFHHKQIEKLTKGEVLFGRIGLEVGRKNWSLGVNGMLPISQNLASKNIEAAYRWSINLNYIL
jgi:hypothetical protein